MDAGTPPNHAEIHLWSASLEVDAGTAALLGGALADDERDRARRFHFERDRTRWVAGRGWLRQLLGAYLDLDPARLQFETGAFGKPRLGAPAPPWLRFNLSHSEDLLLIAVARDREVGVDVERVRDDVSIEQAVARFLSSNEREELRRLPPERRARACLEYWTRKEACVKATGRGVAAGLREFEVTLAPCQLVQLTRSEPSPSTASDWTLSRVDVGEEHIAAVAIEGDAFQRQPLARRLEAALQGVAIAPILS